VPHAVESLAVAAVVNEMAVDVDQRSTVGELSNRVAIPDFLYESLLSHFRRHHGVPSAM
jgi:hypothetical protein